MKARVLCHNGLGFIIIRKSCTTSVKWVVREAMGLDHTGSLHTDPRLNYKPMDECGDVATVAIIRCPLRRLLSTWRNKMHDLTSDPGTERLRELGFVPGCSFEEFVRQARRVLEQEGHLRHQYQHLPERVDYMMRFEAIGDEWPLLQQHYDWLPELPIRNATQYGKASWQDYYTATTRRQVSEMYRHDLALWQALCARPAGSLEDVRWIM